MDSSSIATLIGALALGVVVPWTVMRMFVASVAGPSATTTNYRGIRVSYGLGVVWLVWGVCALLGGFAAALEYSFAALGLLTVAGLLATVAFGFGLVDDAYGSGDARGFKGHLAALARGRLTTGGMKLVGVGAASLGAGFIVKDYAQWGHGPGVAGASLVAGVAIALTANLVNLMDLRPGRALKCYALLAAAGWGAVTFVWMPFATRGAATAPARNLVDVVGLALFLAGPLLAVWRYDLREVGMLGDAGANPMGAVAGLFIVCGLPLWGLIAYAIVMLVLNLASERVSFSRVIDSSAPLRWLDGLGRLADAPFEDSAEVAAHDRREPE